MVAKSKADALYSQGVLRLLAMIDYFSVSSIAKVAQRFRVGRFGDTSNTTVGEPFPVQ